MSPLRFWVRYWDWLSETSVLVFTLSSVSFCCINAVGRKKTRSVVVRWFSTTLHRLYRTLLLGKGDCSSVVVPDPLLNATAGLLPRRAWDYTKGGKQKSMKAAATKLPVAFRPLRKVFAPKNHSTRSAENVVLRLGSRGVMFPLAHFSPCRPALSGSS